MDTKTREILTGISTATLTTVLLKKGLRNVWLRGAFPKQPHQKRVAGTAFTLRFVPAREDLATPASWSAPVSTRTAIEAMPPGVMAVVGAQGVADAGIFGDILCARMRQREVAYHHCEWFLFAKLALAKSRHGRGISGIASQMVSAQALYCDDLASTQQRRGSLKGRKLPCA